MNEEYTKYFEKFHKDRLAFLSGKDKYKKCKDCENDKKFIEKDNELIYNCGSNEDTDCGNQFTIQLPQYENYQKEKQRLKESIHGSLKYNWDKEDLSGQNLEKLNKYMKLEEEYLKQKEEIEKSSEKLQNLETEYIKDNKLNEKLSDIQELYIIKKKYFSQKNKIMKLLKDPLTIDEKKRELRKEYAKLIYENQKETFPLMEKLEDLSNVFIKTKKEKIEIHNENLDFKKSKKVKKSKKEKFKKDKQEKINYDMNDKGYNLCKELSESKLSQKEIDEKRKNVYNELMKEVKEEITKDNYKDLLKDKEIKLMFELYDKNFFDNKLSELSKESNCQWVICWNNRCTKTAGRQRCRKDGTCKIIEIELSAKVFVNVINKMINEGKDFVFSDDKNKCDSILTCLQLTFEHELIHGLQDCFCQDWMYKKGPGDWSGKTSPGSGHSKTFMSILNNKFGHVDFRHKLFSTGDEKIKEQLKEEKKNDKLGDKQEEIELEIAKDISKKEKKYKKEKKSKKDKSKKLTKEGKKWAKAAIKDMKEREK